MKFLLSRTQRVILEETKAKPSNEMLFLLQRMELRKWRESEIVETTLLIKEYVGETKWIHHMRNCKSHCMLELALEVQRYGGRCCPWYLDLNNNVQEMIDWEDEDFEEPCLTKQQAKYLDAEEKSFNTLAERPQIFKTYLQSCPRVQDYQIGNYWVGANLPSNKQRAYFKKSHTETIRFIKDRMSWAEKIISKQIRNACKYLKLVIRWDLNPQTMPQWNSYFLEDSLLDPHIFLG